MSLTGRLRTLAMFRPLLGRVPAGHLWYLWRRMRDEKPHRFAGQTRINTFFPPHPSPAFDRFCGHVAARRRVPYSVYLAVTPRCPYRCGHCSYAGREGAEPATDALLDRVAQVKALGACTLGLTGGEPLLRGDLERLVAAAGPEMATVVFTTGHGLDAARARRLAQARVTCVTIGVESADPAEHDAARGAAGSFEEARAAAEACREAGVYLALSTVALRERLAAGALDCTCELARHWGAGELRVLTPVPTGALAGRADAALTADERAALRAFHVRRNRRRGGPAVACFAQLESPELFGCGAGYHHLFIDAGGEVCPCDLTPLSFGSLAREPLADIWGRMGRWFDRPRRACLMCALAPAVAKAVARGDRLPLEPRASERLCPPRGDEPLPEAYRRLL